MDLQNQKWVLFPLCRLTYGGEAEELVKSLNWVFEAKGRAMGLTQGEVEVSYRFVF